MMMYACKPASESCEVVSIKVWFGGFFGSFQLYEIVWD